MSGSLFDGPKLVIDRFSVELVEFRVSHQKSPGCIQDVQGFCCDTSKHNARRAVAEIVRESATGPGGFLCPVLKVLNEQYLNVDIQFGGELFSYMVGSNDSGKVFGMARKEFSC